MGSDAALSTDLGPQARTAHSERVLASLLLPAAAMIRKEGIRGASVEDLVEAVGVSKGTLYYHIRTKEGLLYWIHESVTNEGCERWAKVIEETAGQPAITTLRRMIEEHCQIIREYTDCVAVISEEMKNLSPEMQKVIRERRASYQTMLESVLERGVENGEFVVPSVRDVASIVIGTLNSMYRWFSVGGPMSAPELAETITELLLHGLHG